MLEREEREAGLLLGFRRDALPICCARDMTMLTTDGRSGTLPALHVRAGDPPELPAPGEGEDDAVCFIFRPIDKTYVVLAIAPAGSVEHQIVLIFVAERDYALLAAIMQAQAVALSWDPHDHPAPELLALPVPATAFANAIDADGGRASIRLPGLERR